MSRSSHLPPSVLLRCFRAIARLCLRYSFRIQDTIECLKAAFIRVAEEELERRGQAITTSRLSIMTGLHRRDVDRLRYTEEPEIGDGGLLAKVVGQWQLDRRFTSGKGKAKSLDFGTERAGFTRLVRSVSRELNPATVLFELERLGIVEKKDNSVELRIRSFSSPENIEQGLSILAEDTHDLISAVSENLARENSVPNLHLRTFFDNVRPDELPQIRAWIVRRGHEFHEDVREYLSKRDQDINPSPDFAGRGVRIAVGSFSLIDRRDNPKEITDE